MYVSVKRIRADLAACVIVVAAMLMSAISACACAHHSFTSSVAENCHSSQHSKDHANNDGKRSLRHREHGKTEIPHVDSDDGLDSAINDREFHSFEIPCNCGEANSVTAINVRTETIRQPAVVLNSIIGFDIIRADIVSGAQGSNNFSASQNSYHTLFKYRSGPSRAPPRL